MRNFFNKQVINLTESNYPFRHNISHLIHHKKCKNVFKKPLNIPNHINDAVQEYKKKGYVVFQSKSIERTLISLNKRIIEEEEKGKEIYNNIDILKNKGWTKFSEVSELFTGDIKSLIEGILLSYFSIDMAFFTKKNFGNSSNETKIWHTDSGPSTHINVFIYLVECSSNTGATTLIDWEQTKNIIFKQREFFKIHKKIPKKETKILWDQEVKSLIKKNNVKTFVPNVSKYSVVLFNNNLLHRAEPVKKNYLRKVLRARISPSKIECNKEKYISTGVMDNVDHWPIS